MCVYTYICVYICVCIHICACIHIYMCVYTCVCVCVCMCIYIYISPWPSSSLNSIWLPVGFGQWGSLPEIRGREGTEVGVFVPLASSLTNYLVLVLFLTKGHWVSQSEKSSPKAFLLPDSVNGCLLLFLFCVFSIGCLYLYLAFDHCQTFLELSWVYHLGCWMIEGCVYMCVCVLCVCTGEHAFLYGGIFFPSHTMDFFLGYNPSSKFCPSDSGGNYQASAGDLRILVHSLAQFSSFDLICFSEIQLLL